MRSGQSIPSRSRHCLRRYYTFLQRVQRGETKVCHVSDKDNPSDFLTKFVGKAKHSESSAFATNYKNCVAAQRP